MIFYYSHKIERHILISEQSDLFIVFSRAVKC